MQIPISPTLENGGNYDCNAHSIPDEGVVRDRSKKWGDYTSEDMEVEACHNEVTTDALLEDAIKIIDAEPILVLPPPSSRWVVKKVAEIRRRMGYSFKEIEHKMEDFFWEIERRRKWRPKNSKPAHTRKSRGSYC